jgi:hypothetical protein
MNRFGFLQKAKLSRNTLMLSVLGGGALGSFLFAVSAGKQEVHNLHPIFQRGANPTGDLDYQRSLEKAKERGDEMRVLERSRLTDKMAQHPIKEDVDTYKLGQNRILRRRTLTESIRKGHGHGLSDSHGGQWVHGDDSRDQAK